MKNIMEDYLLIESEIYTIKIYNREDGYNTCFYRIAADTEHKICESSTKKILQRLIYAFGTYIDEFNENEIPKIITDLKSVSNRLKVPEIYVNELVIKYFGNKASYGGKL